MEAHMLDNLTMVKNPTRRAYKVADVVARFRRQKNFMPEKTYGHVYAAKVSELAGDRVMLDATEEALIALKRRKIISGRRMVNLLGQHQREIRA
jgi:hypothetical protein